jgi:hypothetical protein
MRKQGYQDLHPLQEYYHQSLWQVKTMYLSLLHFFFFTIGLIILMIDVESGSSSFYLCFSSRPCKSTHGTPPENLQFVPVHYWQGKH